MTDPEFVVAGYLLTWGVLALYGWRIRNRTKKAGDALGGVREASAGTVDE